MVDLSKVSNWAKEVVENAIKDVAKLEGDLTKIDTGKEALELSKRLQQALSGTTHTDVDAEYISGFMIERTFVEEMNPPIQNTNFNENANSQEIKVERFYNDDGTYYEEITKPGEPREYVGYDKEGRIRGREISVLINGVEYTKEKSFFNEYGELTRKTYHEYDEHGKELQMWSEDFPVKDRDYNPLKTKEQNASKVIETSDMSAKELKQVQNSADTIAKNLHGYTTNQEQYEITNFITNEVNSKNILEFLVQYEKSIPNTFGEKILNIATKTAIGAAVGASGGPLGAAAIGTLTFAEAVMRMPDSFFEQLVSESNFPEKQDLLRKLTSDLKDYTIEKFGKDDTRVLKLELILRNSEIKEKQAEEIDEIVKELINSLQKE